MNEYLNRIWRVIATGFCFICFGVGGLILGVFIFPVIKLIWKEPKSCSIRARKIIKFTFSIFVWMMRGLGVLTYEFRNSDLLNRNGLLVLANHPSLIDVVFLMAFIRNADCIVKASLVKNPVTWGPVTAAGFVLNNSGPGMINDCLASNNTGKNLIIFPEGTRTPINGVLRLQRGAANLAIRGRINITPVWIKVHPPTLRKNEHWYHVPRSRPHFVFEVKPDIQVDRFLAEAVSEPIATRRLTDFLTQYFLKGHNCATT